MKVSVDGGTPVRVSASVRNGSGVSWVGDSIFFAEARGISRVSANGGEPEMVVEAEADERLSFARLLPDGRTVLFTATSNDSPNRIMSHSLATGERRVLVDGASDARYLSSGHLLFRVEATLRAVHFDLDELEVVGGATAVVENIAPVSIVGGSDTGGAYVSVSENGNLIYLPAAVQDNRLTWVSRQGVGEPLPTPLAAYAGASISPDGARLALELDGDLWLYDIARGAMSRLTFTADNLRPVWTSDGTTIVFASRRGGSHQLHTVPTDGSGKVMRLESSALARHPDGSSPDGSIVFHEHYPDRRSDLWVLEMEKGEERPFLQTEFNERLADVSPDGRWLAYTSDESGQDEVYARPYPDGGAKVVISTGGGRNPLWSSDGDELFYRDRDRLLAVSCREVGGALEAGRPLELFQSDILFADWSYDVAPGGERFLVVASEVKTRWQVNVVLNWFQELKRLVPSP